MAVIMVLKASGDVERWHRDYEETVKNARPKYGGIRVTPPHCLFNMTGFAEDAMWVVEVWDSEEEARHWAAQYWAMLQEDSAGGDAPADRGVPSRQGQDAGVEAWFVPLEKMVFWMPGS
jgi:hypothetical protein